MVRFEEVTRYAAEVQDALISVLSEKQIAIHIMVFVTIVEHKSTGNVDGHFLLQHARATVRVLFQLLQARLRGRRGVVADELALLSSAEIRRHLARVSGAPRSYTQRGGGVRARPPVAAAL